MSRMPGLCVSQMRLGQVTPIIAEDKMTNIDYKAAQKILMENITPLAPEQVSLVKSLGRIIAHDVYAQRNVPCHPQSAMDGFAVHEQNLETKGPLTIYKPDEDSADSRLQTGQVIEVSTGTFLPYHTAAVIPIEWVEKSHYRITMHHSLQSGQNIRPTGEDFAAGDLLTSRGTAITPGLAAALGANGCAEVSVVRQPRAVILSLDPNVTDNFNQIGLTFNSNGIMLSLLVQRDKGLVQVSRSLTNLSSDDLLTVLDDADIVITVGGTFAHGEGEARQLIKSWGYEELFWGTQTQPGSHNGAGLKGNKFIICLSGNPSACAVGYELFVSPLIRGLQGLPAHNTQIDATCTKSYSFNSLNVYRFLRARATLNASGWQVEILPGQKASMIKSLINYNALIVVPPQQNQIQANSQVHVILMPCLQ